MPLTEEISEFFDAGDHATAVTFTPSGGSATTVNAIFQNEYLGIEGGTVDVEGSSPVVFVRSSDVTGVAHSDAFTIDGTGYSVVGIQPDGTGVTQLILAKT
jgi:hypothetical protein